MSTSAALSNCLGQPWLGRPSCVRLSVFCIAAGYVTDGVHGTIQVRPYLMSDGGNVEFVEIDGPVVYLRLQVSVTVDLTSFNPALPNVVAVMP